MARCGQLKDRGEEFELAFDGIEGEPVECAKQRTFSSNAPLVCYAGFLYQAKSWNRARRVVAKVEWHNGELFPRVGFIVTNPTRPAKRVVRFYNQRGKAEQWIKEGKNAVKWTRLSCHDFVDNQVRLQLFVLAYNLGNFLWQAVLLSG